MTSANGNAYQYDSQNELVAMNGGAVRLVYDGDGNRVAKTVNGVTTRYLVDDLNPTGYAQVVEETVNGAPQWTYTYGLQRISENQIVNNTWNEHFRGLFFFSHEALAYYMPSIMLLSVKPHHEEMLAADSLLMMLSESVACAMNDDEVAKDMVRLTTRECGVLVEWLQRLCSFPEYKTGINRARIDRLLVMLGVSLDEEDMASGPNL